MKKKKNGKIFFSAAQKVSLMKQCQQSPLTIEKYARSKNIGISTLYTWSKEMGIPLKETVVFHKKDFPKNLISTSDKPNLKAKIKKFFSWFKK